jgi:hypothetical protein
MEWVIRRQEPVGEGSEVKVALPHGAPGQSSAAAAPC